MPGATSVTDRKSRHVRRAVLRIDDRTSRHRVTWSLEEALRLVHLPGEDEGRVYHFRRLALRALPAEASRAIWLERLQQTLTAQAHHAIHGADPRSLSADAVFFHDEDEALETILQAALRPNARPAWFWPAATGLPAESHRPITAAAILDRIREVRSPQNAAAIIIATVHNSDPTPLLAAIPTFTLRDWLRALETPSAPFADAPPIALPTELSATLKTAATNFGYTDPRTLWLATQTVLSLSPPTQSTGIAVKRAHATLRQLELSSPRTTPPEPASPNTVQPTTPTITPPRTLVFHDETPTPPARPQQHEFPPTSPAPEATPPPSSHRVPSIQRGELTQAAGLYFLLHALRHLGIAEALETCPALIEADFVAHILRALAAHANIEPADPILCAIPTESAFSLPPEAHPQTPALWPAGFPSTNPDHLLRAWALAVRRWCWTTAHISARDIILRPGLVWLTRTDLDITLTLSTADLRIRRLGLDVDPGWLPWFGRFGLVVRFHYRDRLDAPTGAAPC
jgi:hypothetical protein